MNTQNNMKVPIIAGLGILLLIIGGTYYFSTRDNAEAPLAVNQNAEGDVLPAETMRITAKHSYAQGKHIIAGEVEVPTPCTSLDVAPSTSAADANEVTLRFVTSGEENICAQVIAARRFKVEFNAAEKAVLKATWNGKEVILNLIEALPGEDLNNFDIYIKG